MKFKLGKGVDMPQYIPKSSVTSKWFKSHKRKV